MICATCLIPDCDKPLDRAARDNLRIPVAVADVEEKSEGESSEGDHVVPQNVDARQTTEKSVVAWCGKERPLCARNRLADVFV